MTYRLTIWSRGVETKSTFESADAGAVWEAWTQRRKRAWGLVSLVEEGEVAFPDRRAFAYDHLLMTSAAREAQDEFATSPLASRFDQLHAVRRFGLAPARPKKEAGEDDTPPPAVAAPLLPPDLVDRLRDVEVMGLTGHRSIRTALIHLDVRLGSDLAGLTEADLLPGLGGDRSLLRAFQDQASAYAARLNDRLERASREKGPTETTAPSPPSAPTWREVEAARLAEQRHSWEVSEADKAARVASFQTLPLAETVRNSLAHLDARNAGILARKLGLDGSPEIATALMADFGVGRARVHQIVEESVAKLARRDGWPRRLESILRETLPVSAEEMSRNPWFKGLGPEHLMAIASIGTGEPAYLVRTSSGPVVGPLKAGDWNALRRAARALIVATDLDATPAQLLADLRKTIPQQAAGYERFLLREIGWPSEPGEDWLLRLKGGNSSAHALIRQVTDRMDAPLATGTLIEAVGAYLPASSTRGLREAVNRAARHLPDGRWQPRRRWEPDDPVVERVRQVCERHFEDAPPDAPSMRTATLSAAIADDPALEGIAYDMDAVALAVRTSPRFSVKGHGWIAPRAREDEAKACGPRP